MLNGRECHPIFPSDIKFETSMESDERFYRTKLDTSLTFTDHNGDYSFIREQALDTAFRLTITATDIRTGEEHYTWHGIFYKTDCAFNDDDRTLSVSVEPDDLYKRVLECIGNKYDLVSLAPTQRSCTLHKRPIMQILVAVNDIPDEIVTNYMGNMTWEQTASINSEDNDSVTEVDKWLTKTCGFKKYTGALAMRVKATGEYASCTGTYTYNPPNGRLSSGTYLFTGTNGYTLKAVVTVITVEENSYFAGYGCTTSIIDKNGNTVIPEYYVEVAVGNSGISESIGAINVFSYAKLDPNCGEIESSKYAYYIRYLLGMDKSNNYLSITKDKDIVPYNLNYKYCAPADFSTRRVLFSSKTQGQETEYGRDSYGYYFTYPEVSMASGLTLFPIARSTWSPLSVWLVDELADELVEDNLAVEYTLGQTYPLSGVLEALLKKIDPEEHYGVRITHRNSSEYSTYLYGKSREVLISPISAVKRTYYSNPAQKGEITLREVLDMLKNCYNCYWFIDNKGRFRIEHVDWFRSGGAFSGGSSRILQDLTTIEAPRNFKRWAFGQNKWSYNRTDLPERIEFKWTEQSTDVFNGTAVEYKSNYVKAGNTESVTIENFSADVDYCTTMQEEVSDDGWVLLYADNVRVAATAPTLGSDGVFTPDFVIGEQEEEARWRFEMYVSNASLIKRVTIYADSYNADDSLLSSVKLGELTITGNFPLLFSEATLIPKGTTKVRLRLSSAPTRGSLDLDTMLAVRDTAELPIIPVTYKGVTTRVQNGRATRVQLFYDHMRYDMSCRKYEFNGVSAEENDNDYAKCCLTTKRIKTQEEVTAPAPILLDPYGVVITGVGTGEITSMSYTPLSDSIQYNLNLDTEE